MTGSPPIPFSDVHLQDAAHLFEPPTTTFTLNAIIVDRNAETFTVNAVVVDRNTETFSVDAIPKATLTDTSLVDALVLDMPAIAICVDALLELGNATTVTTDAIILGIFTDTSLVDARVAGTNEFDADAILSQQKLETSTVGALIQQQDNTFVFTADGLAFKPSVLFLADALLAGGKTHDFEVDVFLQDTFVTGVSLDGLLANMPSLLVCVDVFLKAIGTNHNFTADAKVVTRKTTTFAVDATTTKVFLNQFIVDGLTQGPQTHNFAVDGIVDIVEAVIDVQLLTFETPLQPTVFFDVDAIITSFRTFLWTADATIVLIPTFDFEVDAFVKALGQTFNFSVDAELGKFARLVHTSLIRDNLKVTSVIRRRSA